MITKTQIASLLAALFAFSGIALAEETHTVKATGMAFDPMVIQIEPGDTVKWQSMSTHNVETL